VPRILPDAALAMAHRANSVHALRRPK
jgi:hypothetical protein